MADAQVQILRPSRVFPPHTALEIAQNANLQFWYGEVQFYRPEEGTPAPVPDTAGLADRYAERKQFIWRHLLDPLWGVLYGTYPEAMVDHFQVMLGGWHRLDIRQPLNLNRYKYFFNWVVLAPYRLPDASALDLYTMRRIPDVMELEQACINGNLRAETKPRTWLEGDHSPGAWLDREGLWFLMFDFPDNATLLPAVP
ncbi:hypothetical protein BJ508DRAFT_2386 [Ascobolus immersus RN42]|uniref:Uncharacterized protein n=1 Tax=Ascobolus immersus RN42 TaxID=1160509 RepID=A0A3N4J2G1_ASCIM|nr:hypothetical protein BJ508DRAFT_2386 [Ascobolus immersus RN42]